MTDLGGGSGNPEEKPKKRGWVKWAIFCYLLLLVFTINQYRLMYNAKMNYDAMHDALVGYKKAVDDSHMRYADAKADYTIQCIATSKEKNPSAFCVRLSDRLFPDLKIDGNP